MFLGPSTRASPTGRLSYLARHAHLTFFCFVCSLFIWTIRCASDKYYGIEVCFVWLSGLNKVAIDRIIWLPLYKMGSMAC